jgi:hypothetical protein
MRLGASSALTPGDAGIKGVTPGGGREYRRVSVASYNPTAGDASADAWSSEGRRIA